MPSWSGFAAGLRVHPVAESTNLALATSISAGQRSGAFFDHVEEDEEVSRPLVQDAVEVPPIVASQLAKLAIDLRAVRER